MGNSQKKTVLKSTRHSTNSAISQTSRNRYEQEIRKLKQELQQKQQKLQMLESEKTQNQQKREDLMNYFNNINHILEESCNMRREQIANQIKKSINNISDKQLRISFQQSLIFCFNDHEQPRLNSTSAINNQETGNKNIHLILKFTFITAFVAGGLFLYRGSYFLDICERIKERIIHYAEEKYSKLVVQAYEYVSQVLAKVYNWIRNIMKHIGEFMQRIFKKKEEIQVN